MRDNGAVPATEPLQGRLLVAAPTLADPNFARTVVLVLQHDGDGALGVVLNRPTTVAVAEILPVWGGRSSTPDVVFAGGPVATDSALGVVQLRPDGAGDGDPVGFRRMFGSAPATGLLDLDTPVELVASAIESMRIFAGYAGWGAGQLEGELADDGWIVLESEPGDLTRPHAQDLWAHVLRRQTGDLALLASHPLDPTLN